MIVQGNTHPNEGGRLDLATTQCAKGHRSVRSRRKLGHSSLQPQADLRVVCTTPQRVRQDILSERQLASSSGACLQCYLHILFMALLITELSLPYENDC